MSEVTQEQLDAAERRLFGAAKRMARIMGGEFVLNERGLQPETKWVLEALANKTPTTQAGNER